MERFIEISENNAHTTQSLLQKQLDLLDKQLVIAMERCCILNEHSQRSCYWIQTSFGWEIREERPDDSS